MIHVLGIFSPDQKNSLQRPGEEGIQFLVFQYFSSLQVIKYSEQIGPHQDMGAQSHSHAATWKFSGNLKYIVNVIKIIMKMSTEK